MGAAVPRAFFDLEQNLYEDDEVEANPILAKQLAAEPWKSTTAATRAI